jgi:histidinol-phosphate aminotransferase
MTSEGVETLTRELRALGVEVWPSDANFVLVRTGSGAYELLMHEGLIVRPLHGFGLPDHVRITVGLPEENERLVKALRHLREAGQLGAARPEAAQRAAGERSSEGLGGGELP